MSCNGWNLPSNPQVARGGGGSRGGVGKKIRTHGCPYITHIKSCLKKRYIIIRKKNKMASSGLGMYWRVAFIPACFHVIMEKWWAVKKKELNKIHAWNRMSRHWLTRKFTKCGSWTWVPHALSQHNRYVSYTFVPITYRCVFLLAYRSNQISSLYRLYIT